MSNYISRTGFILLLIAGFLVARAHAAEVPGNVRVAIEYLKNAVELQPSTNANQKEIMKLYNRVLAAAKASGVSEACRLELESYGKAVRRDLKKRLKKKEGNFIVAFYADRVIGILDKFNYNWTTPESITRPQVLPKEAETTPQVSSFPSSDFDVSAAEADGEPLAEEEAAFSEMTELRKRVDKLEAAVSSLRGSQDFWILVVVLTAFFILTAVFIVMLFYRLGRVEDTLRL
ncbi:MAG: hypothetical protein RB296_01675 [Acidobacteriota bacterium]|nr:hypothetical protein [Acidobacteriota bacterium]